MSLKKFKKKKKQKKVTKKQLTLTNKQNELNK